MRVTKDVQSNLGLLNTIRNINKLKNPSHNINLANMQYPEKNHTIMLQKTSQNNNIPIKVKLVKSSQNQSPTPTLTPPSYTKNSNLQSSPPRKTPIDHIYKDHTSKMKTKNNLCNSSSKILDEDLNINSNHINQTEINKLRHSLIYSKEKNSQIEKDEDNKKNNQKGIRKYISMSPKLTLRFNDEKEDGNNDNKKSLINRGFVIKKKFNRR